MIYIGTRQGTQRLHSLTLPSAKMLALHLRQASAVVRASLQSRGSSGSAATSCRILGAGSVVGVFIIGVWLPFRLQNVWVLDKKDPLATPKKVVVA